MISSREKIFASYLLNPKVSIDTRKIQEGDIFFALKGERFDGNDFIEAALEKGCALVIGQKAIHHERYVQVEDSLTALQQLSLDYRNTWKIPVIAITGSNGKTTTKELIRDVLATRKKVYATRGNLNNHIGIPLTILETPADTEIAIIEMGANHQREIAGYCQYARPTHGVITNIGKAHLEGFGGILGVQKGKRELYDYLLATDGVIFCNTDQEYMTEWGEIFHPIKYSAKGFNLEMQQEGMKIHWLKENLMFESKLAGAYNINNIAAALVIGMHFGISANESTKAIASYQPENMRSQWKETEHNQLIIDAYNANPTSLDNAIRNLAAHPAPRKLAIIGAMKEMGEFAEKEHEKVVALLKELNLAAVLIGFEFENVKDTFQYFPNVEDYTENLMEHPVSEHLILIKGSRGIQLEKVLPFL
jgi:UDP-N-acetylmuramoyl-tripeptide--D-alanyl-D-alanine ligase